MVGLVVAWAMLGPPGIAVQAGVAPDVLEGPVGEHIAALERRATDLRQGLLGGSFAAATRAVLREQDRDIPSIPRLEPGSIAAAAVGVPAELAAPVGDLAATVRAASDLLGPVSGADLRAGMAALERHREGFVYTDVTEPPEPPADPVLPPSVRRAARATPVAALMISEALDRHLPALLAAKLPPGDGNGCDVVDELPYLCIGSEADNTYTQAAALLIDLGGDDLHLHPAGAAPFQPAGEPSAIMASVTLDLGGNDRYVAGPIEGLTDAPSGQGYGFLGGVGMLVDVEGDDLYEAEAAAGVDPDARSAYGQGVGLGAGYGALFDLGGDDRYRVTATDGTDEGVWLYGQGVGYLFGGAGVLADLGGGDDSYVLEGGTVAGLVREWTISDPRHHRQLLGQGGAYTGVGVLADDGGTDEVRAAAGARSRGGDFLLDPDWERPELPPAALFPLAAVWAQGAGIFGGAGFLLTGDGPTTVEARGTADATSQASLLVQALGFLGGVGVADDEGGDDTYVATVTSEGSLRREADEGCGCERAAAVFESVVSGVSAQGWGGASGGAALLLNRGGDDRYVVRNDQVLSVVAEDLREEAPAPARMDLRAWPPPTMGQGWATVDAVGALVDLDGADRYELVSHLDAVAEALAPGTEEPSRSEALVLPRLYALGGQGAGRRSSAAYGALLDLGGVADRFEAVAETDVVTEPAGGDRTVGFLWPPFQGSGDTGVFAALGEAPIVHSRPAQGVCAASTGPRGFGAWVECPFQGGPDRQVFDVPMDARTNAPDPEHLTGGLAPQSEGAPASMTLVEPPASLPEDEPIRAVALLRDPAGSPIAGEQIRFDLQFSLPRSEELESVWFNGWEVVAVTDENGIAEASVPSDLEALLEVVSPDFPGPSSWRLRLLGSFDGGPGLHPARAAAPLTA